MSVKTDVRYVTSKKDKNKKVKKTTYKCEGSYVDLDGKAHRYHKRGFATSEEAKEWERVFLIKARNEIDNDITFGDLYAVYKENKSLKVKDRTFKAIESIANNHILPYWRSVKVSDITLKKIELWQKKLLSKTYKPSKHAEDRLFSNERLENIQANFKATLTYGMNMGYIKDNRLCSFKYAKRVDEVKKEMLFWHPNEFNLFINQVDDLTYSALFNILYWCGLRIGEALALNWYDVDLEKATIKISKSYAKPKHTISSPKTKNSYREVLIPTTCLSKLKSLKKQHEKYIGFSNDKWVFGFNKHLDDNSIRTRKNGWCKKAGVKQIRIHDFRHSHVSLLINQGFSPFDIAKRLGHTVEMVNNVYGHWFQDAQKRMVERLDIISDNLV